MGSARRLDSAQSVSPRPCPAQLVHRLMPGCRRPNSCPVQYFSCECDMQKRQNFIIAGLDGPLVAVGIGVVYEATPLLDVDVPDLRTTGLEPVMAV